MTVKPMAAETKGSEGKRVAVIGAGVSGLAATKSALEAGLRPVCFERRLRVGGLWCGVETGRRGEGAAAYPGLCLNTAKDLFQFSDFTHAQARIQEGVKPFDSREEAWAYLEAYAAHFDLLAHVRLGTEVRRVERLDDGHWTVAYALDDGEELTEHYDAVILCSGQFSKAWTPPLAGASSFGGSLTHAAEWGGAASAAGQTVAIVGAGVSGVDIATLAAPSAKKVYLISPSGTHLIPAYYGDGRSYDQHTYSRPLNARLSRREANAYHVREQRAAFDVGGLGLGPERPFPMGSAAVARPEFGRLAASGKIQALRSSVSGLTPSGLRLSDGTEVAVDAVVMCTGYRLSLPYLSEELQREVLERPKGACAQWWLNMVPLGQPTPTKPSLFTVGLQYLFGAAPPVSELQARAVCGILSGALAVPSEAAMRAEVAERGEKPFSVKDGAHCLFGLCYATQIARYVGCYPEEEELRRRDPQLASAASRIVLSPSLFRLLGPHASFAAGRLEVLRLAASRPAPLAELLEGEVVEETRSPKTNDTTEAKAKLTCAFVETKARKMEVPAREKTQSFGS